MYDEYNALVKNSTWILVPRPSGVNLVRSMWLFKHKFHADGILSRYKARLVANTSNQQLGVDFDETFSSVVKTTTIRTVLSLVVSCKWLIHQLDVKNAFLNSDLSETVYMHHPPIFLDSRCLSSAEIFIWTETSTSCLVLSVCRLCHTRKYAPQLLQRTHMVNCNPSRTPVDMVSKLGPEGVPVQDPTLYRSLHTLSRSSAEAEYRGAANVVAETTWLRNLLRTKSGTTSHLTVVETPQRNGLAERMNRTLMDK
nr:ribonuclease H-like domain-containing protein [Tanacetum cinerariifolium]